MYGPKSMVKSTSTKTAAAVEGAPKTHRLRHFVTLLLLLGGIGVGAYYLDDYLKKQKKTPPGDDTPPPDNTPVGAYGGYYGPGGGIFADNALRCAQVERHPESAGILEKYWCMISYYPEGLSSYDWAVKISVTGVSVGVVLTILAVLFVGFNARRWSREDQKAKDEEIAKLEAKQAPFMKELDKHPNVVASMETATTEIVRIVAANPETRDAVLQVLKRARQGHSPFENEPTAEVDHEKWLSTPEGKVATILRNLTEAHANSRGAELKTPEAVQAEARPILGMAVTMAEHWIKEAAKPGSKVTLTSTIGQMDKAYAPKATDMPGNVGALRNLLAADAERVAENMEAKKWFEKERGELQTSFVRAMRVAAEKVPRARELMEKLDLVRGGEKMTPETYVRSQVSRFQDLIKGEDRYKLWTAVDNLVNGYEPPKKPKNRGVKRLMAGLRAVFADVGVTNGRPGVTGGAEEVTKAREAMKHAILNALNYELADENARRPTPRMKRTRQLGAALYEGAGELVSGAKERMSGKAWDLEFEDGGMDAPLAAPAAGERF